MNLCDCFLGHAETTTEVSLLITLVLVGSPVMWSGFGVLSPATLAFAGLVFMTRPVAICASSGGREHAVAVRVRDGPGDIAHAAPRRPPTGFRAACAGTDFRALSV